MDYLLAAFVGIGIAAACGLRAFLPVLGLAIAAKVGWVSLGESFGWLASWPAIAALLVATVVEVASSVTPVVAHALDAIAAPVAAAAGALVMATQLGNPIGLVEVDSVHPMLDWAAAIVAGGGIATAVHAGSATLRAGTTTVSAGMLAPVYGILETVASFVASVLAFVLPVLFAVIVAAFIVAAVAATAWYVRRRTMRRRALALA